MPQNRDDAGLAVLNPTRGALFVIAAAVLFAIKGIFIKLAYRHGVEPTVLLTLRMLISLPFFLVVMARQRHCMSTIGTRDTLSIIGLGLCGYYVASFLDLLGLQYISAGLERMIIYLYPTFVVILGAVFLARRVSYQELTCLAGAYLGISIVFAKDLSLSAVAAPVMIAGTPVDAVAWGSLLTVGSALAFSIFVAFSESLIRKTGSALFTSMSMFTASIAIVIHFLATHSIADLQQPWQVYLYAIVLALLSTVLAALMMAEGIRHVGSSRAGALGTSGPVVTVIIAAVVLGEPVSASHVAGIIVIISSIYALTRLR